MFLVDIVLPGVASCLTITTTPNLFAIVLQKQSQDSYPPAKLDQSTPAIVLLDNQVFEYKSSIFLGFARTSSSHKSKQTKTNFVPKHFFSCKNTFLFNPRSPYSLLFETNNLLPYKPTTSSSKCLATTARSRPLV